MANVAEHIISTLEAHGTERIWGIAGDSLNGFTDALIGSTIDWMTVRHEEAGAFAAAAEAEMTGELAVVAGTSGPGNLHLINGLYDAQRSRVPVLAIAAHIPSEEIGTGYFQETHPQELFRECSVYVEHVSDVRQLPRVLMIAMRNAIEQRGVAVLVISGSMFLAEMPDAAPEIIHATHSRILPSVAELERAADVLNEAQKVTILAGAGVAGAHTELLEVAELLQAPIVHALRGKEHVEYDNPYDVGMTVCWALLPGIRRCSTRMFCSWLALICRINSSILTTFRSSRLIDAETKSANAWRLTSRWWGQLKTRCENWCRCWNRLPLPST